MKYVYLVNDIVIIEFPEIDPLRPSIPVTDLYSSDFLSQCVMVDAGVNTPTGWIYDPNGRTFSAPVEQAT
jgi:hypothetical protein